MCINKQKLDLLIIMIYTLENGLKNEKVDSLGFKGVKYGRDTL